MRKPSFFVVLLAGGHSLPRLASRKPYRGLRWRARRIPQRSLLRPSFPIRREPLGQASVRLQGQSPTTMSTWRIGVKAQPCLECGTGEHFIYGTNYDGSQYASGTTERGGIYGFISPTATA